MMAILCEWNGCACQATGAVYRDKAEDLATSGVPACLLGCYCEDHGDALLEAGKAGLIDDLGQDDLAQLLAERASAQLIAAAPDLYEAVAASIEALKKHECGMALIYLRHALKQAEGGAK